MNIKVKLFATLTCYIQDVKSGVPFNVDLNNETTLNDLMSHLSLPEEEVKVAFVNGRAQSMDCQLKDGDEVGIFPPIGGG